MSNSPEATISTERKSSFFSRKPRHIYGDQLLFLLVLLGMAVLGSGTRSLGLAVLAVLTSVIVDILCCYFTRKVYNPRDISTLTSGVCLALMSPATLPYSLLVFGAALAIGIKHIFGGKDNYIFNPTAVAFAFLIICYPTNMLLFPNTGEILTIFGEVPLPVNVGLENHLLLRGEFPTLGVLDFLIGNFPGPIGTTHVLIILISAVCLFLRRSVSFIVTVSCLSVITIIRLLFPLYDDLIGALVRELFGGYLFFGLLFLAGDPQTLPKTTFGKLYYGVLLGVLTIVFRGSADGIFTGRVEGWFIFALLIGNALSYRMDIVSMKVSAGVTRFSESLREKLTAYEHFSNDAKAGKIFSGDLTATMEIDLTLSNYDMPRIDNKVIKINRKKRNLLTFVIELKGSLQEKAKLKKKKDESFSSDNGDEYKPSFILASFKALLNSIAGIFSIFKGKSQPAATSSDAEDLKDKAESDAASKAEKSSDIDIADFLEIADTIAEVEANIEAEIQAETEPPADDGNPGITEESRDSDEPDDEDSPDIVDFEDEAKIINNTKAVLNINEEQ
ncbi:MAG: RnfABCDGE type electron transport complex subunit D [Oscillospiraceae bacterium]|nr:RnfABCDGE type electron transport complex subunit D [Oscillospiraceae bacterium]